MHEIFFCQVYSFILFDFIHFFLNLSFMYLYLINIRNKIYFHFLNLFRFFNFRYHQMKNENNYSTDCPLILHYLFRPVPASPKGVWTGIESLDKYL